MKKFLISLISSVAFASTVFAATPKDSFTEQETLKILAYISAGQEFCNLQVKQEDYNSWVYAALQYGYSFQQLNEMMALNTLDILLQSPNALSIDDFCVELTENLYKELYVE